MRIEIIVKNVHSSKGKHLSAERVVLPDEEARFLIERGQARRIKERKKAETPEPLQAVPDGEDKPF